MYDKFSIVDFLDPLEPDPAGLAEMMRAGSIGKYMDAHEGEFPDLNKADVVLVGCGDRRGDTGPDFTNAGPDAIRRRFYAQYNWHRSIHIADAGNIRPGATLTDTYAALKTVVAELTAAGKKVIVIGGSHDLTLAQYEAFRTRSKIIEATVIDALIDLATDSPLKSRNFLMELLTDEPNFIRHYSHIGFQSFLVHPTMLETMDKLRFDCFRLGHVRELIDEMEPVLRNSALVSLDISALKYSDAPCHTVSPNGLTGEEACTLIRYAGMGMRIETIGFYGYAPDQDVHELGAKQIAQMMWYFIDGLHKGRTEAALDDRREFIEYHTAFTEVDTVFLQSRRTGRWWMQLPDGAFIACTHRDYQVAANNQIPERWMRAQERS